MKRSGRAATKTPVSKPEVLDPIETEYIEPGRDASGKALPFYERHRGPFILAVTRPFATKPNFYRTEWLGGERLDPETNTREVWGAVEGEEVEELAMGFLTDPRDTVVDVTVWCVRDQQFVMSYQRRDQ